MTLIEKQIANKKYSINKFKAMLTGKKSKDIETNKTIKRLENELSILTQEKQIERIANGGRL